MRRQTASHCAFAKLGPQTGDYAPGSSNVGEVALSTVTVYVCLMFLNTSSAGCGGGAPLYCAFAKWGFKPTSSRRRLEGSLFDMITVESGMCSVLGGVSRV